MHILLPKLLQQLHAYDAALSAVFSHSLSYSFIMITFCVLKTNSGFFLPLEFLFLLHFMIFHYSVFRGNQKFIVRPNCHIVLQWCNFLCQLKYQSPSLSNCTGAANPNKRCWYYLHWNERTKFVQFRKKAKILWILLKLWTYLLV